MVRASRSSSSTEHHAPPPSPGPGRFAARVLGIVPSARSTSLTIMGNAQSTLPNVLQPPPSPGKSGANRLRNVFKTKGKQRAVTAPIAAEPSPLALPPPPPPKSPRMQEAPVPEVPAPLPRQRPLEVDTMAKKEDWRRSDATMASHHTVRPRSSTVPRPVSMAESTSTVMAHRRLSALVAEAEFVLPDDDDAQSRLNSLNGTRKRHSMSLHFAASPSPTVATPPATSSAAAEGYIGAAQRDGSSSTAGSQIRGRLAAWTTASASSHSPPAITVNEHGGWAPQNTGWVPQKLAREPTLVRHEPQPQQSTATGMLGFGRRVVRALGMQMPHDTPPSRSPTPERRGPRRTPNAPSGTWSVHTAEANLSSQSQGNSLGPVLRGPRAQSGLVFGRRLEDAVRDTALEHVRAAMDGDGWTDPGPSAPLTDRALPALVVRCVQHIMTWGLEEEGLFRISGRASHIARLRSEFDTGADFDLQASPPGELDPHAVASIFKAYLRELPEPILSKQLTPLFEAAMDAENETRRSIDTAASIASAPAAMPTQQRPIPMPRHPTLESGGCGLPANPRPSAAAAAATINNRPSPLSSSPASASSSPHSPSVGPIPSLTQPALAIAPPSAALLRRFRALASRLPRAHHDLLRTVSSLIRATASRKETRMPLSNLTVVFCPSLGLSPSILRVLCEQEEIWVPLSDEEIEEMRREHEGLERASSDNHSSDGEEVDTPEPETPVPQTPADVRAMYAINAPPTPTSTPGSQERDIDTASFALSSASSSSLATPNSNAASREELALHAHSHSRRTGMHASPSAPNLPGMSSRSFSSKSSLASLKISGPLELTGGGSPKTGTPISFPSPAPSLGPGAETTQPFPATAPGTMFPRTESGDEQAREPSLERPFSRPLARAKRPSLTMLFGKRSLSSLRSSRIMSLSPLSPRTASQPLLQQRASDGAGTRDTVYGGSASEGVSRRASVLDMGLGSLSLSRRPSMLMRRASVLDPSKAEREEWAHERVESAPPVLELGIQTSPLRVPGTISPAEADFDHPEQSLVGAAVPEVVRRTTPPLDIPAANTPSTDTGKTEITPLGELPAPYNRLSLWEDESDASDGGLDGEWASSVLLAADAGWLGAERT